MIEILRGLTPTLKPRTPGKYVELWQLLRDTAETREWLALRLTDLTGENPQKAKSNLWQAAKKEALRVQTVTEGDLLYIRLSELPAPAKKQAPEPAPVIVPTPVAVEAVPARSQAPEPKREPGRLKAARDPQLVAFEMEKLLESLIAVNRQDHVMTLDLGGDAAAYSVYEREMRALATERKVQIETDRKANWFLVTLLPPKNK